MNESEQLRLSADLLGVMRAAASAAAVHGSDFVTPAHLLLGLLADARVGPAIAPLLPGETIVKAADEAAREPELRAAPDEPHDRGAPLRRYESLAFRSTDESRTLYLDGDAYRLFIEGARRAEGAYRPKHLVYGFTAEAVKDRNLLRLFGTDPDAVTKAVEAF